MPIDYEEPKPPPDPSAPAPPGRIVFDTGAPPVQGLNDQLRLGIPAAPDKYQNAAVADRERILAAGGKPSGEGFTQRLMQGATMGWGDEALAAATTPIEMARHGTIDPREGYRYGKARENLAEAYSKENSGIPGAVAETVGGMAVGPTQLGGRAMSAALGGARTGWRGAAARMLGYGVESGGLGAIQGAGNAQTAKEMGADALRGGVFGGILGAPFGAFADVGRRSAALIPSEDELMKLGDRAYRARDALPTRYHAQDVADRVTSLEQAYARKYGRDVPFTREKLRDLRAELDADIARANAANAQAPNSVTTGGGTQGTNPWQATVTPRDIRSISGEIYEQGAKGKKQDPMAGTVGGKIINRILSHPDPATLAAGSPRDAATAALLDRTGRGNFAGGYRAKAVREAIEEAGTSSGRAASGLNFENVLRQKLDSARRKSEFGALNRDEEAQLERLIIGATKANAQRELGNMLGGGGGLGRMVAMGGGVGMGGAIGSYLYGQDPIMGGAAGLALGLTGRGIRTAGNRRMERDAQTFSENLRKRTPEYRTREANTGTVAGPGLTSPTALALRNTMTTGAGGDVRDAIANSMIYNATGKKPEPKRPGYRVWRENGRTRIVPIGEDE